VCCYHLAGHVSCHLTDFLQLSGRGLSGLLTSPCFFFAGTTTTHFFISPSISHNDFVVRNAIIFDCSLRCHVCIARQMPHIYHTSCGGHFCKSTERKRHGIYWASLGPYIRRSICQPLSLPMALNWIELCSYWFSTAAAAPATSSSFFPSGSAPSVWCVL